MKEIAIMFFVISNKKMSYNPFKRGFVNIDTLSLSLIPKHTKVLELGPGDGRLTRCLKKKKCFIVSVEKNPMFKRDLKRFADTVIVGDAEDIVIQKRIQKYGAYDIVYMSAFLAHLKNPEEFLISVKKFLKKKGFVVVTFPNIAHLSARLKILTGKFEYEKSGLFDKTHLHFYTISSAKQLVENAGFIIEFFADDPYGFPRIEKIIQLLYPNRFFHLRKLYQLFPTLFAYQFVLKLRPL